MSNKYRSLLNCVEYANDCLLKWKHIALTDIDYNRDSYKNDNIQYNLSLQDI